MVLRHLCRPRDPCGAEIKAGAVSINDALALSIAELENGKMPAKIRITTLTAYMPMKSYYWSVLKRLVD